MTFFEAMLIGQLVGTNLILILILGVLERKAK